MDARDLRFIGRVDVANRIGALKAVILQAWIDQCKREVPAAGLHHRRVIMDSIPKLLDRLVVTMLAPPAGDPGWHASEVSCEHGEERADLGDYSLDEMIHEYELLREVLYSALEVEAKIDFESREILETFLARSVRAAAVRYADREREKLTAEKKKSERAHQDLHEFFMQAPLPMVIMEGAEHRFVIANPPYEKLIGRKAMGKNIRDVFPSGEAVEFIPILDHVYQTGEPYIGREVPLDLREAGGKLGHQWVDIGYHPFRDFEGHIRGILAIVQDQTAQVEARQALEESREQLIASVRDLEDERELRDRFVAALTHDLRTPMTAAKMNAQVLLRRSPDAETLQTGLTRILGALRRTDQMITDLLDTNRIKAGQGIQIVRSRFELAPWLRSVVDDLVIAYGARFEVSVDGGNREVEFDPSALQRVVENFAGNAVKYGERSGPIGITATQGNGCLRIAVHNEGNPIAPDDLFHLFQPFRRTLSAVEGGQKGWGIGLTLVKGLAEAHGGSVGVTSSPEAGTTFFVDLPMGDRAGDAT